MNIQSPAYQELDESSTPYLNLTLQVNRDPFVFLLYFALVHLFYFSVWDAGFVTDFLGWQERFDQSGIMKVLTNFGVPSLHQFSNFFFYIFYKSFGINGLGWHLTFTTLHTINAFLLYLFTKRLADRLQSPNVFFIAFVGGLFFLLSPYQTEVVVWKVCLNYLLVGILLLMTLRSTLSWLESTDQRTLYLVHFFYILSLFTLELSLMVPLLSLSLLLLWTYQKNENALLKRRILQLVLPQLLLLGGYFIITRLLYGVWIGHYGAETHLNANFSDILGNYLRHFTKYLVFARYFEHSTKEAIFGAFSQPGILIPSVLAGVALLVAYLLYFKRLAPQLRLAGWMLVAFFIMLTPIITLYFYYLLHVENDRYGYIPSMFFGVFLAALVALFPRWVRLTVLAGWLFVSAFYLEKTIHFWSVSTDIYYSLINKFDSYNKDEVYLLNLPDNYNGVLLFRDMSGEERAFSDALQYIRHKPYTGKIHEVAQYNMTTAMDGAKAQRDSTGAIVVTFNQWGNWWWHNGIGASSYEKKEYSFEPKGQSFELRLKEKPVNAVFIYQMGANWELLEKGNRAPSSK
ncbi:MAG: hypothetical protein ACK4TA_05210 [Saprospiraceae bacterium]